MEMLQYFKNLTAKSDLLLVSSLLFMVFVGYIANILHIQFQN